MIFPNFSCHPLTSFLKRKWKGGAKNLGKVVWNGLNNAEKNSKKRFFYSNNFTKLPITQEWLATSTWGLHMMAIGL
jgi:hypothetical protein